jgi:hypothetical protein
MLTDGRRRRTTDDGRKVRTIAHMAWRPGELKSKDRQRTTTDCKIEIVTRFDTDYFFLESFKKQ